MWMWFPQTLNSWLLYLIGVLLIVGGVINAIFFRDRILSIGMAAAGVGFICFAITEGFADPTPRGKLLYRIAIVAFIVGMPVLLRAAYQMVMYG